jgi:drug/metabolite transporter (DMT)-like permease
MRRGPLYAIAASLSFVAMMAFGKIAQEDLSALEIVFWRGFIALPIILLVAPPGRLLIVNHGVFLLRAVFGTATVFLLMIAVKHIGVAECSLLDKLQPMVVACLATLLLGQDERPHLRIWIFLLLGLAGSALIIGPGVSVGSFWGFFAIGAAFSSAAAQLCLRVLARTDNVRAITFYFFAASIVIIGVAQLITERRLPRLPSLDGLPFLLGFGASAAFGQVFLTRAYREDRAAVIAASSYTGPIWAIGVDLLVFDAAPPALALVGGVLIVLPGFLLLWGGYSKHPASQLDAHRLSHQSRSLAEQDQRFPVGEN